MHVLKASIWFLGHDRTVGVLERGRLPFCAYQQKSPVLYGCRVGQGDER